MTQTPHPVQAVVFDMAGTTVDEGKTVYRCVQESLAAFGFVYTLEEVIHLIGGMNKREAICLLMNRKNANIKEPQVEEVFSHFKQKVEEAYRTDNRIKEKAGATELFRYLKSAGTGIKVTLDTGYYRSTADILIRKMGWQKEGLIDFSVTSDEVKQGRPAPYMIQKMMAHYGFTDPAGIVKVGDARSDIEEGHNAGCLKVVGITSEQYKKQDLLNMGATHAIAKTGEIRLKPILMTSIITILALLPMIFSSGLGADLQRPLVYSVIGGLTMGILTALYFVPLAYWFISGGREC